ncbi:MAG: TIGR02147 family protein [Bdellovibrionales bacterium]
MLKESFFPLQASDYLQNIYFERRGRNPHYSMRAFARDLDLSASTLCEFLKGKTSFSRERVLDIGKKVGLSENHIEHFYDLIVFRHNGSEEKRLEAKQRIERRVTQQESRLSLDQFEAISGWHHMALLELVDLGPEFHSSDRLASVLDLEVTEVDAAVERLIGLGLLAREGDLLKPSQCQTLVGDGQESSAVQTYHQQMLEQSEKALTSVPVEMRNFQSMVFSMSNDDVSSFKKDLEKCLKELVDKYQNRPGKNMVAALNSQWWPFLPAEEAKAPSENPS